MTRFRLSTTRLSLPNRALASHSCGLGGFDGLWVTEAAVATCLTPQRMGHPDLAAEYCVKGQGNGRKRPFSDWKWYERVPSRKPSIAPYLRPSFFSSLDQDSEYVPAGAHQPSVVTFLERSSISVIPSYLATSTFITHGHWCQKLPSLTPMLSSSRSQLYSGALDARMSFRHVDTRHASAGVTETHTGLVS
ncbi:hypothetical protein PM082_012380 [Marasmius tenuissimus]|nr:hypothetical protein PM082_012380 [Marasmius tenuissimus]